MDFLDAIFDFFSVADNINYIKKDYDKLIDKDEYLGVRVLCFLSLFITVAALAFFIFIIYVIIR